MHMEEIPMKIKDSAGDTLKAYVEDGWLFVCAGNGEKRFVGLAFRKKQLPAVRRFARKLLKLADGDEIE